MQYSGEGRGHSVSAIENEGLVVVLEDSSRWGIYEGFASRSLSWQVGERISVKPGNDEEFPYLLVNVSCNDSVESRLIKDREQ